MLVPDGGDIYLAHMGFTQVAPLIVLACWLGIQHAARRTRHLTQLYFPNHSCLDGFIPPTIYALPTKRLPQRLGLGWASPPTCWPPGWLARDQASLLKGGAILLQQRGALGFLKPLALSRHKHAFKMLTLGLGNDAGQPAGCIACTQAGRRWPPDRCGRLKHGGLGRVSSCAGAQGVVGRNRSKATAKQAKRVKYSWNMRAGKSDV